jgi:hypothetical protein
MSIEELEEWYKNAPAPEMPVMLNEATKVTNYELFVGSHFEGIKNAPTDSTKLPLLNRLLQMKLLIEANVEK